MKKVNKTTVSNSPPLIFLIDTFMNLQFTIATTPQSITKIKSTI